MRFLRWCLRLTIVGIICSLLLSASAEDDIYSEMVDDPVEDAVSIGTDGLFTEQQEVVVEEETSVGPKDYTDESYTDDTTMASEEETYAQEIMASTDKVDTPISGKNFDSAVAIDVGIDYFIESSDLYGGSFFGYNGWYQFVAPEKGTYYFGGKNITTSKMGITVYSRYEELICGTGDGNFNGLYDNGFNGSGYYTAVLNKNEKYYLHIRFYGGKAEFAICSPSKHAIPGDWEIEKEATCGENGRKVQTCLVCSTILKSRTIPKTNAHNPVADAGIVATCITDGKTEGSHCSICNKVLKAQKVIPATGHNPVYVPAAAPTCTENGYTDGSYCAVCGTVLKECVPIPATGHNVIYVPALAATCTEAGYTDGSYCNVCGTVFQLCQPIPATGHSVAYVPALAPRYQVPGYTEGSYCWVCGMVFQACETIPALTVPEVALPNVKSNGTIILALGEQRQLIPSFAAANGWTVNGYQSKKPAVASIDANGLVTATAEGKAKITVTTVEKKKATLTVQVVDPYKPASVAIAEGKAVTVAVGQPIQLTAVLAPETAQATLTWSSSKPGVATVDANGLVTPLTEGKAKITVQTHNKKKAKLTVQVVDPYKPAGIAIAQGKAVTLRVGEVLQLNAGLTPATAQSALTWVSKKPAVAAVDANGVVTALAKGKTKITVTTYNKKKATVTVNVVE